MKLNLIVAAAALAAAGAANAAVDNFASGNGSISFLAYDNQGTAVGSVFVDLGVNVNDFAPLVTGTFPDTSLTFMEASNTNFAASNTTAVWDFANNTVTKNGQLVSDSATNDFSAFNAFLGGIDATTFRWGVIGGDSTPNLALGGNVQRYLTTGVPTASALTLQNSSATSGNVLVDTMFNRQNVLAVEANDSYYASSATDNGYVAKTDNFSAGKWQNKLKWDATTAGQVAGGTSQTNFWFLSGTGQEMQVGDNSGAARPDLLNNKGTWTLDVTARTLTWSTPIPEPETYALVIAGLAVMGVAARRRQAK